ncbi:MAG: transglycosylase SLT domain-containing protein [Deltaproteobacteria bacterium]|nr:transglycosylase SLT domain-containing protein [Deltaproteobacteria bacterium]
MTIWLRAIFTAILVALPIAASAAGSLSQDRALLAAHDAFLAGDKAKLARHAEKIGHTLDSYVTFWRLRLRLEEADPGELRGFLARNEGTVLAERLRRDWLLVLGKRGQWEIFRKEYPALVKADPDVACYALQERWRRQDASVSAEVKSFFMTPRALPAGCAPVVDAMLLSGELTPRDLRDRFRLLVQANLMTEARRIAERLPSNQAPSGIQIENAAATPVRFLERSDADLNTLAGRELAIVALTRLARIDPRNAVSIWNGRLRERFPLEDQQYTWAMLATSGAYHHLPEAVDWFNNAGEMPLSDEQLAWRTRIALRQGNWPEVKNAIERMSPTERNEPVWIYWLGRSLLALGAQEGGQALLGRIAGEHHFYGRLAAEELGMPLQIPKKATKPTREELAEVASLPGMQRSLALYRLGLLTEASAEWLWNVRRMNDRALLAAAELARVNGSWDRAINTADRTVAEHDFTLRYPAPFVNVLSKQARVRKLDEPLVFGLVRQESRFIANAKSSAGASGLMQLMPSTARLIARKIGMKGFNMSRLGRPEVNAALGAYYLRHVLDGFGGNPALAAAAYNAGPGRARRWCDAKPLEGAIYVETIPFSETRQYVKKVMANTVYYAAVMGGDQRSLKSRLGTIDRAMVAKADAAE